MRNPASAVTYCLTFASLSKTDAHQQARRQERQWPLPRPTPPWRPSSPRSGSRSRRMAREFTRREVLPIANELDPIEGQIPDELRDKMAELGFFAIMVPEEHGGLGMGAFEYSRSRGAGPRVDERGEPDGPRQQSHRVVSRRRRRRRFLPKVATGRTAGRVPLSEPEAGRTSRTSSTELVVRGTAGSFNGAKMWCTYADQVPTTSILFARTDPEVDPKRRALGHQHCFIIRQAARELPRRHQRHSDAQDRLPRLEDLGARLRQLPPSW